MIWLVISGLMIGRWALWTMYAWTCAAFAAGIARDIGKGALATETLGNVIGDATISALIFLFIAIVLDRSVAALRESLREATARGTELAVANQRLQQEMAERERVETQLLHTRKVEAAGLLAAGIAHDFNHLLGLISGYVDRAKASDPPAVLMTFLSGIEAAVRRASAISQKLLSFSRPQPPRSELFDVGTLVQDMRPMLQQLFGAGVDLALELPDAPAQVRFDPAQLELVILNIAANADHAMPEAGRFSLAVHAEPAASEVVIELRDTGRGMDEDIRARIFEPFFTTKPDGEGTGLGLAVARDLIAKAGGRIEVWSAPNEGAAFSIRLPSAHR